MLSGSWGTGLEIVGFTAIGLMATVSELDTSAEEDL